MAEAIEREDAEEIGEECDLAVIVQHPPFQNVDLMLLAELFKVVQGAEMDVWRVVPLVRQGRGDGHVPAGNLHAVFPVTKVGERNDPFLADTQYLPDDVFRVLHGLQGLGKNHVIERGILKSG